jgi:hypothetical protein
VESPRRSGAVEVSLRWKSSQTQILAVIAEQLDLTLVETVAVLRLIRTSRSWLWRFLDRHQITFKKNFASSRTAAR